MYCAVFAANNGSNRFFALPVNEKLQRSEIYGVSFRARVQVIPDEKQTLHTCPQTVRDLRDWPEKGCNYTKTEQ